MTDIITREERMLRLLAGFAYQDWSEYNYAARWYDTDRKPDSWFDDLQKGFERLLRGEPDWGGFWDGEIYDERVVDAMRRALEATWPCDTASVLEQLKRLAPNALGTDGRYPFVEDPIYGMYCTFCNSEADEMNSISHASDCEWARLWNAVIEK